MIQYSRSAEQRNAFHASSGLPMQTLLIETITRGEAIETVGLPFPSAVKLNQNPGKWPDDAVLGSFSDFVDTLTRRG
jgi:hypothetical protein